jgi:hypothetical protein
LFGSSIDACRTSVDFAFEKVVDAPGKDSPIIDKDAKYNRTEKYDWNYNRGTNKSAQDSSPKALLRFNVRYHSRAARITTGLSWGYLVCWWITYWHKGTGSDCLVGC